MRNDKGHADEICTMALALLSDAVKLKSPLNESLQLRFGIHSGKQTLLRWIPACGLLSQLPYQTKPCYPLKNTWLNERFGRSNLRESLGNVFVENALIGIVKPLPYNVQT